MKVTILILAGGYGTRLQSVVADVPKSLAPIRGRPFLFYLLDYLQEQRIGTKVILSLGYKADRIVDRVGLSYKDLEIDYYIEATPLGTGGAIKNSLSTHNDFDHVLVMNGDTYAEINFQDFLRFHLTHKTGITLASKLMSNFDRYGSFTLGEDRCVTGFNEKTHVEKGYINCGSYLISHGFYQEYIRPMPFPAFSFEKEILEKKDRVFKIGAFISDFYFIDIGIPQDYERAEKDFKKLES